MTNQIEAIIRFHSFSAFCPIFISFCLIACLPNAGPPVFTVSPSVLNIMYFCGH